MSPSVTRGNWSARQIAQLRLQHQRLCGPRCSDPAEVVRWLGAAQAQEYYGAKWSIAQRCASLTGQAFEAAFDRGDFVRTHAMRPTWHFIAPEDLRWLQRLTGLRVLAVNASMHRKLDIDARLLRRSRSLIERELAGQCHLTREELAAALAQSGIECRGPRLAYIVMHAELEGVICSGPRRGRQFTYTLVEERVRESLELDGDDALAELTRRYFQSHGPATAHDFSRWSGLTLAAARRGLAANASVLMSRIIDGERWWFIPRRTLPRMRGPVAHLLSIYDELLIGYGDHRWSADVAVRPRLRTDADSLTQLIVLNGLVVGRWTKVVSRGEVRVDWELYQRLEPGERAALNAAVDAFQTFHRKQSER